MENKLNIYKSNFIIIIPLFLLAVWVYFRFNNNDEIKNEFINFSSKTLTLPTNSIVYYNEKDTTMSYFNNSRAKLIVYTDSSSCTSCLINKMHEWASIINYASKYKEDISIFFIFYPKDGEDEMIKSNLLLHNLDYPILIDRNGDFEKLNPHLPKNKAMHTFLLDENNKVILVGNPLHNKEIEKLFYKMTQEKLSK